MSGSLAKSAAPPYALRVWCDNSSVYTEIPGKAPTGMPHVMAFALSEGGLSKCLNLLRGKNASFHGKVDIAGEPAISPGYVCPSLTSSGYTGRVTSAGTETQRAHAQAILKRLGIL